ncbi:MAG: flagellar basal body L-ring protein FlgH [Rhodospirillales bacterium]|nr:flagellar basal body L-ring protein FlgH [Rhodospirillales bacterium]
MTNGTHKNTPLPRIARVVARGLLITVMVSALSACQTFTRLSEVGDGPVVSEILNPVAAPNYQPVSMPMPAPQAVEDNPNSLWRSGAKAFFKDHRAKEVGDILTVSLALDDSAVLSNSTTRDRSDSEKDTVTSFLGWENHLNELPFIRSGVDSPGALIDLGNAHSTSGEGDIDRSEKISLELAAVITQILPNGNLVILGRQEVNVNSELRELMVTGIVRISDIDTDNSIDHTRIAEMRVAYGGRGTLSDLQQPRWGMQMWDILFPF